MQHREPIHPVNADEPQSIDEADEVKEMKEDEKCDCQTISRIFVLLLLIVVIVVAIVEREKLLESIENFLDWLREHPGIGPVVLSLIYVVWTLAFLPGSLLTIGSGFVLK